MYYLMYYVLYNNNITYVVFLIVALLSNKYKIAIMYVYCYLLYNTYIFIDLTT